MRQNMKQITEAILREINSSPEIIASCVEEELLMVWKKELERRKRDAARKRLSRLCTKILAAPTPEEAARIKAEHYPGLSADEISKIETRLEEKRREKEPF